MKKTFLFLLLAVSAAVGAQNTVQFPWLDRAKSFHERAQILVDSMTLEEKVAQLGNRVDYVVKRYNPQTGDSMVIIPAYQYWNEANHGVIDDGHATSFPCLKAMSSTWDTTLVHDCARMTSNEARWHHVNTGKGLDYWCPTINMSRDPRWGRDEENYGEDTYLASRLAVNFLHGLQDEPDGDGYWKLVGCAKHFAANNYENGRHSTTSFLTEKNMREYYLPVFEACVKEGGVHSVMAAYNALADSLTCVNPVGVGYTSAKGGLPCSANKMLLTDILRREWGFKGYTTSDCAAVSDVHRATKHLFWGSYDANNEDEVNRMEALSTGICIKAGLDNNCEFKNTSSVLQRAGARAVSDAFKQGETQFQNYVGLTEADIDTACVRLLESRFALGEFDEPYTSISWNTDNVTSESDSAQALALKAAQESITLLKNDTVAGALLLPLSTDKKVALVGPFVNEINTGGYSGNSTPTYQSTPFQAFCQKLGYEVSDGTKNFVDYDVLGYCKRGEEKFNKDGIIQNTAPNDSVVFNAVDFGTNANHCTVNCATKTGSGEGKVNFYLDGASTPFLSIDNSGIAAGSWGTYVDIDSVLTTPISGTHRVMIRWTGSQSYVGNWKTFRFYNPDYNPMEDGTHPLYMLETVDYVGEDATDDMIARAVKVARNADVVIYCGGLQNGGSTVKNDPRDAQSGRESVDRTQLTLPGNQQAVLRAMRAVNPNIVLCFYGGSSMDFTWEQDSLPAILACWYNGQAQGQALCDVVYGDVNPAGHLTQTWYNHLTELPQADESVFKRNGMLEYDIDRWGYTYMYYGKGDKNTHQDSVPLYPFGYGLSYTTFAYSNFQAPSSLGKDETKNCTVSVQNTGSRDGATVVQIYANFNGDQNYGYQGNMRHKLVGFSRVFVPAGQTVQVQVPVKWQDLSYYDQSTHQYKVAGGNVTFELARNSWDVVMTQSVPVTGAVSKETYISQHQDDPSVIEEVKSASQFRENDCIYTVLGAYVGPASCFDKLPKGIYVLNGVKYIKK